MDYKEKVIALLNSQELSKEQKEKLENIFPELKESKDDRIVRCLLNYFSHVRYNGLDLKGTDIDEVIAWLEKQSENKSDFSNIRIWKYIVDAVLTEENGIGQYLDSAHTEEIAKKLQKRFSNFKEQIKSDKTTPKFKVNNYIVPDNITSLEIWKVVNIDKDGYYNIQPIMNIINSADDEIYRVPAFIIENDYRLWTIGDAKDGDVLVDVYGNIGIFDKCYDFDWMSCCSLGNNGGFQYFTVEHENEKTYPATKEQCDMLFQKMKEAGYEWDSEKKEVKKIEPKALDADKVIAWIVANICDFEYYVKLFKKDLGL